MDAHTLFTYRDIEELRRIQDEREVFTFTFVETKDIIDACPEVCIDISALVCFLQSNKSYIQPVYINFEGMTEDTVIISNEAVSVSALELLPFLISSIENYFPNAAESSEQENPPTFKSFPRQKIFKYNNSAELDQIVQYSTEHSIPIATFSRASGELRKEFEQFNKSAELALMDLTSVCYAIEDNKALVTACRAASSAMRLLYSTRVASSSTARMLNWLLTKPASTTNSGPPKLNITPRKRPNCNRNEEKAGP